MCKLSTRVCLLIIWLLIFTGVVFAADRQPLQLTDDQRNELNTFFSNFSEVGLEFFVNGKISEDELVRFGLLHIIKNRNVAELMYMRDQYGGIPPEEVDYVTNKYFGKIVANHRSIPQHTFVNGHYPLFKMGGEGLVFSRIQSLYDNGDGTYTAKISVYFTGDHSPRSRIESVDRNEDGSYTVRGVGYVDYKDSFETWEDTANLKGERNAMIKPVYDGDEKRYILIAYQKST